ncbi:MAG: amidohydrolase [Pseudoruegeria sp.]
MINAMSPEEFSIWSAFRQDLHRYPEISGEEEQTALRISEKLKTLGPSQILTGLGGHGVAAVFESGCAGPTVLFRAELDALPINELNDLPYASRIVGKGHLCGHDGHMTMLLAFGQMLAKKPVARGRVVLMFQPAEEDGSGARSVVADPAFAAIHPDWAFAIHNLPGRPIGTVGIRSGLINCASRGLSIKLTGITAHAADPETGISPVATVSELLSSLTMLGQGGAMVHGFRMVTITHVGIGEPTFGIAPADARMCVTLRTTSDDSLDRLTSEACALVSRVADGAGLTSQVEICDDFAASVNDPVAVDVAMRAMDRLGISHDKNGLPMRASEDFGVFGQKAKAAMLCLGSGVDGPALHNPDYDFKDELIPVGAALFDQIARD